MIDQAKLLITLGVLLLLGFLTDGLGRRLKVPRVTLLLIFGFVIGPSAFNLLPQLSGQWFPAITDVALVMVAFLLGESLTLSSIRRHGRLVLAVSITVVVVTSAAMTVGLVLLGAPLVVALLFAGIAPATDPAATTDVIHETKAEGPFARTLLGIVAVDDAWGLIVFSITLAVAQVLGGQGGAAEVLLSGARDLGGAFLLGVGLGVPMAYLTGRVRPGEPTLAEALGTVLLCGGLAMWLDVSFLLSAMVMGTVVANLASHHERPFHAIEGIQWPFMILFFVLAGASLQVESLPQIGLVGLAYVILRVVARIAGAWIGAAVGGAEPLMRRWMGTALMPQAGVALGMALVATARFPELRGTILPVVISATVVFEIIGPVLTRIALLRVGEAQT